MDKNSRLIVCEDIQMLGFKNTDGTVGISGPMLFPFEVEVKDILAALRYNPTPKKLYIVYSGDKSKRVLATLENYATPERQLFFPEEFEVKKPAVPPIITTEKKEFNADHFEPASTDLVIEKESVDEEKTEATEESKEETPAVPETDEEKESVDEEKTEATEESKEETPAPTVDPRKAAQTANKGNKNNNKK